MLSLSDFKQNQPLAEFTTFKVGGPAKYFFQPENYDQLIEVIKLARAEKLCFFVLGGGSNVLFSDDGFDGLVIRPRIDFFDFLTPENKDETQATFSADFSLAKAVKYFEMMELDGLAWAAGIPGTVGGAIVGNAGAFGAEMKDDVLEVLVYDLGQDKVYNLDKTECGFAYRSSIFKQRKGLVILEVVFKVKSGDPVELKAVADKNISYRLEYHPMKFPSAGSTFKNIEIKDLSKEAVDKIKLTEVMIERGKIPAWFIIEKLGLKGKQIGGAQISEKHANFVVNKGDATAQDIYELIELVKLEARDRLGVEMREEVVLINFNN